MTITYFTPDNYNEVVSWWKSRESSIWSLESLPTGLIVSKEGRNLAVLFMYSLEGTDVAQICLATTNPENKFGESYRALDLALDALLIIAKRWNKKRVVSFYKTSDNSKAMSKMLSKKGLLQNDLHSMSVGDFNGT